MSKLFYGYSIKTWIVISGLIIVSVITVGLIFGISIQQTVGAILITILLFLSAILFQFLGKRNSNNANMHS